MTDTINNNPGDDEDGLFDPAQDTFPSKFHLRDRLVAIYPDGENGMRPGDAGGDPYPWYSSTTVVLDDGPNGWQAEVRDKDGDPIPNLVPSVAENGPQVLEGFQWMAGGFVARMKQKLPNTQTGLPGSIVGRVNVRKGTKGSPPWGIEPATPAEIEVAMRYKDVCKGARQAVAAKWRERHSQDAF